MTTNTLIKLPSFSYTSLDFETIVYDIKSLIRQHPEYNQEWDDFLETNAGRMFVETMAYIVEKLAARTDWVAQEMFVSTATQRQSLINILKLINHRPSLPRAAKVNVKAKITKWNEPFQIPKRETIIGLDTNGNAIRFECIDMANDGKPDYNYQYTVQTGTESNRVYEFANIPFYQGTTYTEDSIFMDGVNNETYTLEQYPIIENSIRIFSYDTNAEFPEVTSFISPEAQQNDLSESEKQPPYMVEINSENKATIKFGSSSLVKVPSRGQRIKIMYRVGGGQKTNIVSGAINTTKTYLLSNNSRVTVMFSNPEAGFGGADEEDLETARLTAPISLRSANKTVTREDYISHLEESPLVLHANVIGKENEPEEIFEEYGYNLPPLETWIFTCPQRDNYNSIDPFYFNKFMKIGRPYSTHKVIDSEEIVFTNTIQTVHLKKVRPHLGTPIYIVPSDNLTATPYYEGTDFEFNEVTGAVSRISTADGGTIPAGTIALTVNYISDSSSLEFYTNTVKTFGANDRIYLDTVDNSLYPTEPIIVKKTDGTAYVLGKDYSVNYVNNYILRNPTGSISMLEKVSVQYANNWVHNDDDGSEETLILDSIADKKMICVDNVLKDSLYTTFDVVATVYCYKNLRNNVESTIKDHLRNIYNIENAKYNTQISKSKVIADMMGVSGVRFVDIAYLGTNYEAYRRFVLDTLTLDEINSMNANKVENFIPAKYNEMLVLANDHFEGISTLAESQRSGLILTFKDA